MFHTLIWVIITRAYTHIKIHQAVHKKNRQAVQKKNQEQNLKYKADQWISV